MKKTNPIGAICSQLLTKEDLEISEELSEQIRAENVVTRADSKRSTVRLFSDRPLMLSDITPILHDFGFTVIDEVSYHVQQDGQTVYVCRFNLKIDDVERFESARKNVEQVVSASLTGQTFGDCRIYSLVFKQNLNLRQVTLLRAMIEYINQAVLSINFETILHTMTTHDKIAKLLLHYFMVKFNPAQRERDASVEEVKTVIADAIKSVPDIVDDRILKLMSALLDALCRTNYFLERDAITFKVDMAGFADHLRGTQPAYETFIYHPEFRGVHLRMSKVARGGIRWSERLDDYRNEIRSLMTTQEGKNAIIVPDGAKGGFVINRSRSAIDRDYFASIYTMFIHNLLDMVDNVEDNAIVRDPRIVSYDGDDPYFVVAADKGTAAMSDRANAVASERGYWLGDAFASGGSNGFNHKDLGITAKGALKSTERFFLERGIDINAQEISVVGIGSMNGDVFGNGMLLSRSFRLLGAISGKEIFIDPDPDLQTAFAERQRLFTAKDGSWHGYDKSLISKGGGVFLRTDKAIELSDEIRALLHTVTRFMSGEELARALLCLEVDLLFNGGVGTYVKHSEESDLELGDKQNEPVRVNASQLRCRAVCEGGNLGFTQRARIEYALLGGKINLDGIDNAAGVNTSDHEVNIKILLGILLRKGLIKEQERGEVLQRLGEQVVNTVLWNNYRQALAISRDEQLSRLYLDDFIDAIDVLTEQIPLFNRRDFNIPKNANIREILTAEGSIVRPILGLMLSYAKIFIKKLLIDSRIIDEAFARQYLFKYFPKAFVSAYEEEIKHHPLHREIIATVIADTVINQQGVSFISEYEAIGKEKFLLKIKSYLIGNQLFGANDIRHTIFRLDYAMPVHEQYALLGEIEHVLEFSTRWMVKYVEADSLDAMHLIDHKTELFDMLGRIQPRKARVLVEEDEAFNRFFDVLDYLRFAVAVIVTKEQSKRSFDDVATLFYLVVDRFAVLNIINALNDLVLHEESDQKLRRQLLQFTEYIAVHYTRRILDYQRVGEPPKEAFESFIDNDPDAFRELFGTIEKMQQHDEQHTLQEIAVIVNLLMASVI